MLVVTAHLIPCSANSKWGEEGNGVVQKVGVGSVGVSDVGHMLWCATVGSGVSIGA